MIINLTATAGTTLFHYRFDQHEVLIGRAETVDLRLPHSSVSLVHLCVRRIKDRLMVVDSGSTNGTTLDGVLLEPGEPARVKLGSRLEVGVFEVVIGELEPGELDAPENTASYARRMVMEVMEDEADAPALVVQNGPNRGERLEISGAEPLVVGRETGCDLRLRDADASRRHLEVREHEGEVQARDMDSKNGVLMDGEPMTQGWQTLLHGAQVKVGKTRLRFRDPAESFLRGLGQQTGDEAGEGAGEGGQPPETSTEVRRRLRRVDLLLILAGAVLLLGAGALILYLSGALG